MTRALYVSTNAQPKNPLAYSGDVFKNQHALAKVIVHEIGHVKQALSMESYEEWSEAANDPSKVHELHEEVAEYEKKEYKPKP